MLGARAFGAPNCLGFSTRYSGISDKPIIKQQEKILKSLVEVDEKFNFKPEQAVELSLLYQKIL